MKKNFFNEILLYILLKLLHIFYLTTLYAAVINENTEIIKLLFTNDKLDINIECI